MASSNDISKIYAAISACMGGIGVIGKDKTSEHNNFKYRGVDDVMNALQPIMIENHVFTVPQVLESKREERNAKSGGSLTYTVLTVKYVFYAEDGSSIEAIVIGEGMDSGDKSSNKAMAAAFKYACFQVFCIPTVETHPDPDAETPLPTAKAEPLPLISAIDAKFAHDFAAKKGVTEKNLLANIKNNCGAETVEAMNKPQYNAVITWLTGKPDKG